MTHSSRLLVVLGISAVACGTVTGLHAQEEAGQQQEALAADAADAENLISELMTLEKIRRQSLDSHGFASLDAARAALQKGDFEFAREQYKQALEFIGNRPGTQAARTEARSGMAEAFYQDAKLAMKKNDYEKATPLAAQAKEFGHPQADRLIDALKSQPPKAEADVSAVSHRINEEEYKEDRDDIRRRLRRSRQYYTTGEYDKSLEECELILRDNPYNVEAMEWRNRIADRMKTVSDIEFEATRSMMIRDVRDTWTAKRYAIDSAQKPKTGGDISSSEKLGVDITKTADQVVQQKLREIVIPEVTFRPPATIIDAVDFFKQASRDYDKPDIPLEQRGVNLVLKLSSSASASPAAAPVVDPFAGASMSSSSGGVPPIPAMSARFINLYDALKLVCEVTSMKFKIRGNIVMIVPLDDPDTELLTRSYNVLASLSDRVSTFAGDMGNMGGGDSTFMSPTDMSQKQDWKVFFEQLGVKWPTGSSISYLATIGKLRVTNTSDQLAVFEQVLEDLNVTPRLIEIEARFVEVAQEDLNSLGFEWLLNSDFSFNAGGFLDKALNMREFSNKLVPVYNADGTPLYSDAALQNPLVGYAPYTRPGSLNGITGYRSDGTPFIPAAGGQYGLNPARSHNASVGAIDGSTYSTGVRSLNTAGNPIAGTGGSINDQFMRVNAFLGNADLSMILHMLSQRSDTDLLSAPKVVTKSGQEAVMKVVTEYIYPTEFEVQEVNTGSGGNSSSGSTSVPVPFMVEPQNFEMREVGVILQVVPEVSAEGQMINLMLNPQVVSEPVWKNYGTKIPYTRAASSWSISGMTADAIALLGLDKEPETEYTELPMEQPFFHVRSVNTQLSVYNGATVVMGGLITEDRKTMEDKIPGLGDLPYIGRLFRTKSERSIKRNLLVFVTARLVDPAGRVVRPSGESALMMPDALSATPVQPQ